MESAIRCQLVRLGSALGFLPDLGFGTSDQPLDVAAMAPEHQHHRHHRNQDGGRCAGAAGAALAQVDALEPAAGEVAAGDGSQRVADGQEQQGAGRFARLVL